MRSMGLIALLLAAAAAPVAAQLVVLDSYGSTLKPGMRVEASRQIDVPEGARVSFIAPDGRTVTYNGAYSGPAMRGPVIAADPKAALAALIGERNARTNSVATVRGAGTAAPLPDPWLIDISRPGQRCVREGEPQIWWRPQAVTTEEFNIYPLDKSWVADMSWEAGTDRMEAPDLWRLAAEKIYIVRTGIQEDAVTVNVIPESVSGELMLTAWMLEKGCTQQADAFLRRIAGEQNGAQGSMTAAK